MSDKKTSGNKASGKKPASKLGRGLSALMADISVPEAAPGTVLDLTEKLDNKTDDARQTQSQTQSSQAPQTPSRGGISELPIDKLERNAAQPRKFFDMVKLAELSNSIKQKGVLQPILVRPLPAALGGSLGRGDKKTPDRYQIVAGERRWHAAQAAGLETIPALIRDLSDREVLEIGVIENVQRADLNPMEEASAYGALIEQFGRKQREIAEVTGKSRPYIANSLRLLNLPELAKEYLERGEITAGHARAILAAPDPQALTEAIVQYGLSVRGAEQWANTANKAAIKQRPKNEVHDANIDFVERKLAEYIGMDVRINHKNPGGTFTIKYKTMEQFDDLVRRIQND